MTEELRLNIIRKLKNEKKISRKSQNCVVTQASAQSPLQKLIFGNSRQNLHKNRYMIFLFFDKYFVTDCR